MTPILLLLSFLHIWIAWLFTVRSLSYEIEYTASVSWQTYCINTLYSGAAIHHMTRLRALCEGSRKTRWIAISDPLSHPLVLPLGASLRSMQFHSNDKTNRLKVCHCGRDLNQLRYTVADYYQIVHQVWPAAGAAVNDCQELRDDYGSLRDTVCRRNAWSRAGETPDH